MISNRSHYEMTLSTNRGVVEDVFSCLKQPAHELCLRAPGQVHREEVFSSLNQLEQELLAPGGTRTDIT